jgi:hypothetical protein
MGCPANGIGISRGAHEGERRRLHAGLGSTFYVSAGAGSVLFQMFRVTFHAPSVWRW